MLMEDLARTSSSRATKRFLNRMIPVHDFPRGRDLARQELEYGRGRGVESWEDRNSTGFSGSASLILPPQIETAALLSV